MNKTVHIFLFYSHNSSVTVTGGKFAAIKWTLNFNREEIKYSMSVTTMEAIDYTLSKTIREKCLKN